ncbi:MAG: hypothetical protein RSB91_04365 [Clostridia bacterium]
MMPQENKPRKRRITPFGWLMIALWLLLALGVWLTVLGLCSFVPVQPGVFAV